jgi:hypothetical protein
MKKIVSFVLVLAALSTPIAHAQQISAATVFAQALIEGSATSPLPSNKQLDLLVQAFQRKTNDSGPVVIQAKRLFRFKQQSRCGRVIFSVVQPSSGVVLSPGGQLNVCEDSLPPWRVCKNNPTVLISPQDHCHDNSEPQDTPEVDQAIKNALANGDLSQSQVRDQLKAAEEKKGATK